MTTSRPNSFSARQIIGIVLILGSLMHATSMLMSLVYVALQYMAGNPLFPIHDQLQQTIIVIVYMVLIGGGLLIGLLGVFLLRDKNGRYIKYLRN